MKLLIIYHAGLAEDSKAIFREFAMQGVDLTVIVPSKFYSLNGRCFEYSKKDDEKSYRFIPVGLKTGFKFIPLFFAIRQAKPDVIHVLDEYSSIYLTEAILCRNILFGKKVPIFSFAFQNIPFRSPPFIFEFSARFFKRIIYKVIYSLIFWYHNKNISGVAGGNSEALLNVKNLNPNVPAKLIFWGVDLKEFFPKDQNASREELGIQKNIKLFGYFGRLIELRGVDKLILAVGKIDNCHLMIVGDGECKDKLNKLADYLGIQGKIYWRDSVKPGEILNYYNCIDAFVFPSETTPDCKEQYGRVLVEAMSCQIPVVGSDSGAIPEVLNGYPKHLIFSEGNTDDLIDKLEKITDLKFPENFDVNNFLQNFSVENFVAEHIKFYKSLLKK